MIEIGQYIEKVKRNPKENFESSQLFSLFSKKSWISRRDLQEHADNDENCKIHRKKLMEIPKKFWNHYHFWKVFWKNCGVLGKESQKYHKIDQKCKTQRKCKGKSWESFVSLRLLSILLKKSRIPGRELHEYDTIDKKCKTQRKSKGKFLRNFEVITHFEDFHQKQCGILGRKCEKNCKKMEKRPKIENFLSYAFEKLTCDFGGKKQWISMRNTLV